jgi:hypothetical protein
MHVKFLPQGRLLGLTYYAHCANDSVDKTMFIYAKKAKTDSTKKWEKTFLWFLLFVFIFSPDSKEKGGVQMD